MKADCGRIFVTGVEGFWGAVVGRWFRTAGWEVCGLWHEVPPDPASVHRAVRGDLVTMDAAAVLVGAAADVLVHCAALSGRAQCKADPARAWAVNVEAARFIGLLLASNAAPGIYHAGGPDRLSRHEIGLRIAAAFRLSSAHIVPIKVERPHNLGPIDDYSLDCTKAASLGMQFTPFDTGIRSLAEIDRTLPIT